MILVHSTLNVDRRAVSEAALSNSPFRGCSAGLPFLMDRRLIGALLVVAALVAAIVVPVRQGLRVAGNASLVELPADPAVGDCLLGPAAEFWDGARVPRRQAARVTTAEPATNNPLAPIFGPCGDSGVAGEVVAILSATGDARSRLASAEASGLDCRAASLEYAGLTRVGSRYSVSGQLGDEPVSWKFSINLRTSWVFPSAVLQAAGRTWVACVASPVTPSRYAGSIAGAYLGGGLPAPFGTCWDRPETGAGIQTVGCDQPHKAQLVASGTIPTREGATVARIRDSCRGLTASVMGRADPTAGGGLTIKVSPEIADGQAWRNKSLDVICFVTPTEHSLAASVIGLGNRPIPYSG